MQTKEILYLNTIKYITFLFVCKELFAIFMEQFCEILVKTVCVKRKNDGRSLRQSKPPRRKTRRGGGAGKIRQERAHLFGVNYLVVSVVVPSVLGVSVSEEPLT